MTADQVIKAIHEARYTGSKEGLTHTRELLKRLQIDPGDVRVVHVAGTNGKGSVCAMLESALRAAGLRTGLYTSPFLQRYNERFAVSGLSVTDDEIASFGMRVLKAAEGMNATSFELGTALAMLIFKTKKVDIAVLETGMGGRLDPTNVMHPCVSVITAIGMDHMETLGDTIEKIAYEKAGIIKHGVPAVVYPCEDNVYRVFEEAARQVNTKIVRLFEKDAAVESVSMTGSCIFWHHMKIVIPLPGRHQCLNAVTAAAALKTLGISSESISKGIAGCVWPARMEWAGQFLIDGAHNAHGAAALRRYTETFLQNKKRVLVTGMLSGKITDEMIAVMSGLADDIITVTPKADKAVSGERLKTLFANAESLEHLSDALEKATRIAGPEGVVIIAGSLYLAGEARTLLRLKPR